MKRAADEDCTVRYSETPLSLVVFGALAFSATQLHAQSAPPPAAAAGFHRLTLNENFDGTKDQLLQRWSLGLWYQTRASANGIKLAGGIGRIAVRPKPALRNTFLSSWPRTFRFGYFEARMRWEPNRGNWTNFWLAATEPVKVPSKSRWAPYCEIDVAEASAGGYQATVHDWITQGHETEFSSRHLYSVLRAGGYRPYVWHTYGVLWRLGTISFYFDGKMTGTMTSPKTCDEQDMQLVFGAARHDTAGQTGEFDWVRVWQ